MREEIFALRRQRRFEVFAEIRGKGRELPLIDAFRLGVFSPFKIIVALLLYLEHTLTAAYGHHDSLLVIIRLNARIVSYTAQIAAKIVKISSSCDFIKYFCLSETKLK